MSIKEVFSHLHFLTKKAPVTTEIYFSSLLFSLLSPLYLLFLSLFSLIYLLFISSFTLILPPPLPLLFIFLYFILWQFLFPPPPTFCYLSLPSDFPLPSYFLMSATCKIQNMRALKQIKLIAAELSAFNEVLNQIFDANSHTCLPCSFQHFPMFPFRLNAAV